jgi:hypothetical protein
MANVVVNINTYIKDTISSNTCSQIELFSFSFLDQIKILLIHLLDF